MILSLCADGGWAADPDSDRIQRIECGLRAAVAIDGHEAESFHLIDRLQFYKVPGVSIAVIDHGKLAWARGYGVREAGSLDPVAPETLFQAASISKPVAAIVALRLVEQGSLTLDENVNLRLRSWKLPENEWTRHKPVSLRLLLSHRAGLTDYAGFREARLDRPLPTLRDILETGRWTPAPIRVGLEPDSRFAYSGGGYCLAEQLLEDVSGKSFPRLAHELVLNPLLMHDSSFDQSLNHDRTSRAAVGHQRNGKKLAGKWNLYPATSAAGLWTTPSDLARFAIALQTGREAGQPAILSPAMTAEMLSTQGPQDDRDSKVIALKEEFPEQPPASWGLGIGLLGRPPARFFHTGSNPGYQCELQAALDGGQGAVVMTNGDQGWRLAREILAAIAREYDWQRYDAPPQIKKVAQLAPGELRSFVGQYRISFSRPSPWTLHITMSGDQLFAEIRDYAGQVRLHPESGDSCFTIEDAMTLKFVKGETGAFTEIVSDLGWRAKREREE